MNKGCTFRWSSRGAGVVVCVALLAACGPAVADGSLAAGDVVASPLAASTEVSSLPAATRSEAGTDDTAAGSAAAAVVPGAPPGTVRALAEADGRTLAVGVDDTGPAAWSVDDDAWRTHEVAQVTGVPRLDAVASDGVTGIAFGAGDAGGSQAWTTDDLRTWRPVDTPAIAGRVAAVTVADGRWIAVGDRVDPEGGEAYEGVVWAAGEGAAFTVLSDGLALSEGTVSDVAVANGTVVVAGFDVAGGLVWTASGDDFTRATGPFEAATVDGVAATPDGFIALGRGLGDLALRAWSSTDGSRWEAVEVLAADLEPQDEIHDVATVAGVVTVGGGTGSAGAVWTFENGTLSRVRS